MVMFNIDYVKYRKVLWVHCMHNCLCMWSTITWINYTQQSFILFEQTIDVYLRKAKSTHDDHGDRYPTLRQTCSWPRPRAQYAFKNLMIHGVLQFTLCIAFCCVLHRCKSQDIRCWRLFMLRCKRINVGIQSLNMDYVKSKKTIAIPSTLAK